MFVSPGSRSARRRSAVARDAQIILPPQGRPSITSGVSVPSADVTGATTLYYVPHRGDKLPLWNGRHMVMESMGSQLSLALDSNSGHTGYHQSGKNFDIYGLLLGGPRIVTGVAWTSDTSRGTGAGTAEITLKNGLWVNANAMVVRFGTGSSDIVTVPPWTAVLLGTMRASANGQCSYQMNPSPASGGTANKLYLDSAYHNEMIGARCRDSDDTWTYSDAGNVFRQANAGSAGGANAKIEFVACLPGTTFDALYLAHATQSGTSAIRVGVGYDSTSTPETPITNTSPSTGIRILVTARAAKTITDVGMHTIYPLETGPTATVTWNGDNGSPTTTQTTLFVSLHQ